MTRRIWLLLLCALSLAAQPRAAWMKTARWGVMTHYLADWRARTDGLTMSVEHGMSWWTTSMWRRLRTNSGARAPATTS